MTIILLCSLFPLAALADEATPLIYTRAQITIIRQHVATPNLPWQSASDSKPEMPLDVEVRDGTTFYNQKGWFSLNTLPDRYGILLAFAASGLPPVVHAEHYAPIDILMIDKEGKIIQIAPNLVLANLEDDIYPNSPVLAFLILKGGACAQLSINPGDEVQYKIFKKPPVMLSVPK